SLDRCWHVVCLPAFACPPPAATLFPYTTLFRSPSWIRAPPESLSPMIGTPVFIARSITLQILRAYASEREPQDLQGDGPRDEDRSEEHTSELQSRGHLVCRLLLEKKKHHCYSAP